MPTVKRHNHGFALIIVLLTIAVLLSAFAAASRMSLQENAQSRAAENQLNRKWLLYSAQKTLLPRASSILASAPQPTGRQASAWYWHTSLPDGATLDIKLEDEQSKLNLNTQYTRFSNASALALLRRLKETAHDPSPITWFPADPSLQSNLIASGPTSGPTPSLSPDLRLPPFTSYRQFLDLSPGPLKPGQPAFPPISSLLTIASDGRINFKTAPDQVLLEGLSPALTPDQIAGVISLRAQFPGMSPQDIMDRLKVPPGPSAQAAQLLVNASSSASLWVKIQDPKSTRLTCWTRRQLEKGSTAISRTDW